MTLSASLRTVVIMYFSLFIYFNIFIYIIYSSRLKIIINGRDNNICLPVAS